MLVGMMVGVDVGVGAGGVGVLDGVGGVVGEGDGIFVGAGVGV